MDDARRPGQELAELLAFLISSGKKQRSGQSGVGPRLETGPPPFERFCVARMASEKLGDPVVYGRRSLEPAFEVVGVEHRTPRETRSARRALAHVAAPGHRRGVTNPKVASAGTTPSGSPRRFSSSSSAFSFGWLPTPNSKHSDPLGR